MKKMILIALMSISSMSYADGIQAALAFNQQLNGLSGQFQQTVQSGKKTQKTSGTFAILRPGYFKWQYQKPYQQLIIGDGKHVWLYDQDLEQATRKNQNSLVGSSPAAILADQKTLERDYTLNNDGEKNGIEYVIAQPKNKQSEYQHIRLGFKNNQLQTMRLNDSFGNITTLHFSQLNTANKLKSQDFQFTPPSGVDVLAE